MTFDDDDPPEPEPSSEPRLDHKDVEAIASAIAARDVSWSKPQGPLGLTPTDWTPHLVSSDGRVCYIHVVWHIGEHWRKRIKLARRAGRNVVIAAPLECWHSDSTLLAADDLGAQPIVVSSEGASWDVESYKSIARLIAHEKLLLKPENLKLLGTTLLRRAQFAKGVNARGRGFEDFLAFLFSQVPDFEIFAQNFNTATEEIDIVIKNRRTEGRAWPPNAPLVLVSGKNTKEAVGASAVTSLEAKIINRRGMCRLGFLCASGRISKDAYQHQLRSSRTENILALIDGTKLLDLLTQPAKLASHFERLVIEASLR